MLTGDNPEAAKHIGSAIGITEVIAAGVLKPWFNLVFQPELAGLAMAISSVTVVTF